MVCRPSLSVACTHVPSMSAIKGKSIALQGFFVWRPTLTVRNVSRQPTKSTVNVGRQRKKHCTAMLFVWRPSLTVDLSVAGTHAPSLSAVNVGHQKMTADTDGHWRPSVSAVNDGSCVPALRHSGSVEAYSGGLGLELRLRLLLWPPYTSRTRQLKTDISRREANCWLWCHLSNMV